MKKSLSQAIALAALVGGAATAQAAIEVNPDGIGGALLYPIYSVNNGNSTLVSVVNTTDDFKAVKVRFVEGKNSAEVLDFHLYMSPKDVWSGSIVATETGAKLMSNDKSCIAGVTNDKGDFPAAGLPFNTSQIVKDGDDVKVTGAHADRVRVGHFEVLEMGVVADGELQKAIDHTDGVPGGCNLIRETWEGKNSNVAWANTGSSVNDRTNNAAGLTAPTGGLYGTGAVINIAGGWSASYDAVALGDPASTVTGANYPFYATVQHPRPGSIYPNLSTVLDTATGETTPDDGQLDDVTAALSVKSIYNDYFVNTAYGAETDLVVTFPTKRFYTFEATDLDTLGRTYIYGDTGGTTNPFVDTSSTPSTPIRWSGKDVTIGGVTTAGTGTAPVVFEFPTAYDKDENENTATPEDLWVSPRPLEKPEGLPLNFETNVISINGSDTFGTDGLLNVAMDVPFLEGWVEINRPTLGIPAIGFANIVTKNGAEADGVLRNFAQTFKHKTVK